MVPAAVVDKTIADLLPLLEAGRHPHRRRQFLLRGRHPAREGTGAEGNSLRGRRHERRRVGLGTRLLHDDRRRDGRGSASRSDLSPRSAPGSATFRARRDARNSAALPSKATCIAARTAPAISSRWSTTASNTASWPPMPRASAFCTPPTSGSRAQRHRRRDDTAARSRALSVRPQPRRHRRSVAARQRDRLVAAGSDGESRWPTIRSSRNSPAAFPIPAKAAGRSRPPSTKACRCRC